MPDLFDLEAFLEDEKVENKNTNNASSYKPYSKDHFLALWETITSLSDETKTSVLDWLEDNGYFLDPASARYHSNFEGGLCEHSIRFAEHLQKLTEKNDLKWSHDDSPLIIGLLHDICKVGTYKKTMRNVKDEKGKWISVPWYQNDDKSASLGLHGDRSIIYLLMLRKNPDDFSEDELSAIRWHMGPSMEGEMSYFYNACREDPRLLFVHTADMMATADETTIEY